MLGYPGDSFEPLFTALKERIEAKGGRVLIDRPVASLERERAGLHGRGRRPAARSAAATIPRAFPPDGPPERYDAVVATVPNDVFLALAGRPRRRRLPREARDDRVPHGALPAARARPPVHAVLLDERGRPQRPVRRPRGAHELHRRGALRRPALPLRRQLRRAGQRAAGPRSRRAARRVRAEPAEGQPGLRPVVGEGPLAVRRARRPADRHRRLPRDDPAAADRRARASCSPTRRRSIPRTAARTTPCASASRRPGRSRERRRLRRRHARPPRAAARVPGRRRRADAAGRPPRRRRQREQRRDGGDAPRRAPGGGGGDAAREHGRRRRLPRGGRGGAPRRPALDLADRRRHRPRARRARAAARRAVGGGGRARAVDPRQPRELDRRAAAPDEPPDAAAPRPRCARDRRPRRPRAAAGEHVRLVPDRRRRRDRVTACRGASSSSRPTTSSSPRACCAASRGSSSRRASSSTARPRRTTSRATRSASSSTCATRCG